MLTALLVGVLGTQTVTFTHPCANSAVVLEALGKELGVKMAPIGSVQQDYFLVNFKDVTPEALTTGIASALNATWVERNGVHYLDRTPQDDAKEAREIEDYVRAQVAQTYGSDELKIEPQFDLASVTTAIQDAERYNGSKNYDFKVLRSIQGRTAEYRLLKSFLAGYGAARVMAQRLDEHAVFSQAPVGTQKPVPRDLAPLFDRYYKEVEVQIEAVKRLGIERGINNFNALTSKEPPEQIRVDVQRRFYDLTAVLEVMRKGRWSQEAYHVIEFHAPDINLDIPAGAIYEFSAAGREIASRLSSRVMQDPVEPTPAVSEQTGLLLKSMPEFEPLGEVFSEPFFKIAEFTGQNVVAVLPDGLLQARGWVSEAKSQRLSTFLELLTKHKLSARSFDNVIAFAPWLAGKVRTWRFPRQSAVTFLQRYDREGRVSLDNVAVLASDCVASDWLSSSRRMSDSVAVASIAMDHGLSDQWFGKLDALALYNGLTLDTKLAARDDWVEIATSQLPPSAREDLMNTIRRSPQSFSMRARPGEYAQSAMESYGKAVPLTTAELLKRGLPAGAAVAIRVYETQELEPMRLTQGVFVGYPKDLFGLAISYRSALELPRTDPSMDFRLFHAVPITKLFIRVELSDGSAGTYQVDVPSKKFGSKAVPPSELPEPIKSRFAEAYARALKANIIPPP